MSAAHMAAPLVSRLLALLEARGVSYCHWKSNNALDRSASGENDLDLLVARSSSSGFSSALHECGFKEARADPRRRLPGVLDYYGFDPEVDRLIHVHAHYQLVLGDDASKNYHMPVESPVLSSSRVDGAFPTPSPELEYVIFIVRMMLKHGTWEAPLVGRPNLSSSEKAELSFLESLVDTESVRHTLRSHVPSLSPELFERCVRVVRGEASLRERSSVGRRFVRSMRGNARRSRFVDVALKLWRRVFVAVRSRLARGDSGRRLATGGAIIAIVGGDGSGKTTAVDGLHRWLRPTFRTRRVHMGKPGRSLTTTFGLGLLKAGRVLHLTPDARPPRSPDGGGAPASVGYPGAFRQLFTARDRYLAYRRVRRFASNGGLVVADRFPLPQISLMDGGSGVPADRADGRLSGLLLRGANDYYARIGLPEVLVVLRVHPEIAVRRKTDESEHSVRARSTEVWHVDWSETGAVVVDAGQSAEEVLLAVKRVVWSAL